MMLVAGKGSGQAFVKKNLLFYNGRCHTNYSLLLPETFEKISSLCCSFEELPGGLVGKEFACNEDPLEKGMLTHLSILAWRIPWTEEPAP